MNARISREEEAVKKILLVILIFSLVCCVKQRINSESTYFESFSYDEVWEASLRAIKDIDFTIDSLDKDVGFIAAERGAHVLQDHPPRLSITIERWQDRISVHCRVFQKEYVDFFGLGRKTVREFMLALKLNLEGAH